MTENLGIEDLEIIEEDWGIHMVSGESVLADSSNVLPRIREVMDMIKRRGKKKLLVSAPNAKRGVTVLDLFQAGELLLELRVFGIRIAFIAPHLANTKESRFMEHVGENRGIHIRYFSEPEEALHWIRQ